MEDTPYDAWADYIVRIWRQFGLEPVLVLDLACGTGNITARLAQKGYDMIGIDRSPEMLAAARAKPVTGQPILYLCQDICAFELYGTVDAVVCICDSINYLTEEGQLAAVLALVANYLNPGGLLIFDLNTTHKLETVLGDRSFSEIRERAAYICENSYHAADRTAEYRTAFFVERQDGLYERFDETHVERAFSLAEMTAAIASAGLTTLAVYDELSFDAPRPDSERVFFVVRKE